MKKIVCLILTTLTTTSAFAEKKIPQAYEMNCSVEDDRDGDQTVLRRTFNIQRNRSEQPLYVQHFKVKRSDNDLIFIVGYDREDDLVSIALRDDTLEVVAITFERDPKLMNIFLGSTSAGVQASCTFKPTKIKKLNKQDQ